MTRKCPTCGRALSKPGADLRAAGNDPAAFPFCSDRCRLADLGKWLDGAYRIGAPVAEEDLDEGLPSGAAEASGDGKMKVPQ